MSTKTNELGGYSYQFWFLCLNSLLFFSSLNMALSEFPQWLSSLGGADYKGFIIGLFTISAALSRPLGGRLADRIGRLPMMYLGAGIALICFLCYPHFRTVFGFLVLRFLHGLAVGLHPTALFAMSADIIPYDKRGEGVGILSTMGTIGMALGPGLGGYLSQYIDMFWLCNLCALFSLFSLMSIRAMKETLPQPRPFSFTEMRLKWSEVFEPRVIHPAVLIILGSYSFGMSLTLTPDWLVLLGASNKGLFLMLSTLGSIGSRLFSGKLSDKFGRVEVLLMATFLQVLAMVFTSTVDNLYEMVVAALFMGVAYGVFSPTLTAWAIDMSHPDHRGRAMATVYVSLEIGIGLGAFVTGMVFKNTLETAILPIYLAAVFSFFAFLYMLAFKLLIRKA